MIEGEATRPQTAALVLRPQDRYHTRLGCSAGILRLRSGQALPAVPRACPEPAEGASRPRRGRRGRPPDSRRDGGATRIHCGNLQTVTVLVVLLCLIAAGCGYYTAGHAVTIPDNIRTIAIPAFVNQTQTYKIEQLLTACAW